LLFAPRSSHRNKPTGVLYAGLLHHSRRSPVLAVPNTRTVTVVAPPPTGPLFEKLILVYYYYSMSPGRERPLLLLASNTANKGQDRSGLPRGKEVRNRQFTLDDALWLALELRPFRSFAEFDILCSEWRERGFNNTYDDGYI